MPHLSADMFEAIRNLLILHLRLKEDRVALLTPILSALPIFDRIQWNEGTVREVHSGTISSLRISSSSVYPV